MRIILALFLPLMFVMTIGLSEKAIGAGEASSWYVVTTSIDPMFQFKVFCRGTRAQALDTAASLRAMDNGVHALPQTARDAQIDAGLIEPLDSAPDPCS